MREKIILGIGAILCALTLACGPKMASRETMQKLEELRAQIEKIKAEISACGEEKKNIEMQKSEKIGLIEKLKAERDSLKNLLELIKQGY